MQVLWMKGPLWKVVGGRRSRSLRPSLFLLRLRLWRLSVGGLVGGVQMWALVGVRLTFQ